MNKVLVGGCRLLSLIILRRCGAMMDIHGQTTCEWDGGGRGVKYRCRSGLEGRGWGTLAHKRPVIYGDMSLVVRRLPYEYLLLFVDNAQVKPDPPDVLDRQKCLDALAALRHAKWFQVRFYICFAALWHVLSMH